MKHWRLIKNWTPEVYFILFAIWWASDSYTNWDGYIHYPAVILVSILTLQFLINSRMVGLILSGLLGLVSIYLIFALLSDFAKDPILDMPGIRFLIIGGLLIAANITMSVLMFRKYYKNTKVNKLLEA